MKVPYSYLPDQFRNADGYFKDLRKLVKSCEFTLGPFVERFEKQFSDYLGMKHTISTNTGTDALILALKAIGLKSGDEVITVPNTFVATVGAIVAVGARPVFVDCDERYQMDPDQVRSAVSKRTRALLPVHWAGASPDMPAIMKVADKYGLTVVEDACPAVGAKVTGRFAGTFGKVNAFSMHPLKPLNVWGDGGMVVTNDDKMASFLKLYRNHGLGDRDHIEFWGVNNRLQPVQAIVGSRVLAGIEDLIKTRIRNAKRLDEGLAELNPWIRLPKRPARHREVYQIYIVRAQRRDPLKNFLIRQGVEVKVHYPLPLHLQKAARSLGYKKGDFPVCERQAKEILTIPCHQFITSSQIDYMVKKIREFYA